MSPLSEVDAEPSGSPAPLGIQYDGAYLETLAGAVGRLRSRLHQRSPFLAELLLRWMTTLAAGSTPEQRTQKHSAPLRLPWSIGPVEGQVNRLKLLKPQMHGRASFPVLRARVLQTV